MSHVYSEPTSYAFRDVNGHRGKKYAIGLAQIEAHIIECDDKLTVQLRQHETEFLYYIVSGAGYFIVDGERESVRSGDIITVPKGAAYTFGGKLKMLLINTPLWSPEQQEVVA